MQLRLAFAVAAHLEPEILIVDEVLAVGDAAFQRKCLGKMGEVSGEGRTVLLVSHNMSRDHGARRPLPLARPGTRARARRPGADRRRLPLRRRRLGAAGLRGPLRPEAAPRRAEADEQGCPLRLGPARRRRGQAVRTIFFEGDAADDRARARVDDRLEPARGLVLRALARGDPRLHADVGPARRRPAARARRSSTSTIPRNQLRSGRLPLDLYLLTAQPQDYLLGAKTFEVVVSPEPGGDPRHVRDYLGLVSVEQEWGSLRQGTPNRV